MADKPQQPVIIIRKKKKGGHGGHHGGAWKVAYADFVTAMMSFFLLMWLLNVTTSDQRQGLAEYFAPTGISHSFGGSGGVMGGTSISSDYGADTSASHAPGVEKRASATIGQGEEGEEDISGKSEKSAEKVLDQAAVQRQRDNALDDASRLAEAVRREEEKFKNAEEALRGAIEQAPELRALAQHMAIDRTPEGLRIQLIDQSNFSFFPSGSSIPYEKGRDLLQLVGKVISRLSNRISITGHTDSAPFAVGSRRDNWSLSTERANTSRIELQTGGVPDSRISKVLGLADRDPFVSGNPLDPRNRRISIVLLREATMPQEAPGQDKEKAAPPEPTKEPVP